MNEHASVNVIETRGLTKVYSGISVVDRVDWTLPAGSACALLGANGAGKTTTLRLLMGFIPATFGDARLFGAPAWNASPKTRMRVAYVPELPGLPNWMRVDALIRFHSSFYPRWDAARERELRDLFALSSRARVSELSKGTARRLALLLALCQGSELLLLDEPGSGLDVETRRAFLSLLGEYLAQGEHSLVFSTHLLGDVERIANHVAVMDAGRIVEQAPLDTLQEEVRSVSMSRELFERTHDAWELAGVLERRDGQDSVTLTVRSYARALAHFAPAQLPASVDAQTLPFEDIYLALTRHARARRAG